MPALAQAQIPVSAPRCSGPSTAALKAQLAPYINESRKRSIEVRFSLPLERRNQTSFAEAWMISNFVDHDAAFPDSLLDFNNGQRTYDLDNGYNHTGTDFALWPYSWTAMAAEDVAVIAAAPGTIIAITDGQPDTNCSFNESPTWNVVAIQHADASVAIYGHLKSGSLLDKVPGERVERGEFLGFIGSSGLSTAPHLHFEVWDAAGNVVDPFVGPANPTVTESLWLAQPDYTQPRMMSLTTHSGEPFFGCFDDDAPQFKQAFSAGETLFIVATFTDARAGQAVALEVLGPDGETRVYEGQLQFDGDALGPAFWFWTLPLTAEMPIGIYRATARFEDQLLVRDFALGRLESPQFSEVRIEPELVKEGETVTLSWQSEHAYEVSINKGRGFAGGSDSLSFVAEASQSLGLTAKGPGGVAFANVNLEVRPIRTYWVPHFTTPGGGFASDLALTNQDCCVTDVTVTLFTGSGESLPEFTVSLQPGKEWVLDEENRPQNAAYGKIQGMADLRVEVSYRPGQDGGPALWSATEEMGTTFVTRRGDGLQVWDGIALVNVSDTAAEVTLIQRDEAGNEIRWQPEGFARVDPGVKVVAVLNEVFADASGAEVIVESSQSLVMTALRGALAGCEPYMMWGTPFWIKK
jgi:hypothetical protein